MRRGIVIGSIVAVLLVSVLAAGASARVVYVDVNSRAKFPDGTSWRTAFKTVQQGVESAVAGDQVWVADGTYFENIVMKNGVGLFGHFSGGETAIAQRNLGDPARASILDGGQAASVVRVIGCPDTRTRISGFTIRNGSPGTLRSPALEYYGAGIFASGSSVAIDNNIIENNSSGQGAYPGFGGGIGIDGTGLDNGSITIENNTIVRNNAFHGGAIAVTSVNVGPPVLISGNTIDDNYQYGVYIFESSAMITGNAIRNNGTAPPHGGNAPAGGIWFTATGKPFDVFGNEFDNNFAGGGAGGGLGFHVFGAASDVRIQDNRFTRNSAADGGGIFGEATDNASMTIEDNFVSGNSAAYNHGGGMVLRGSYRVERNTITGNLAAFGAGIFTDIVRGTAEIANNVIAANWVTGSIHPFNTPGGGGIYVMGVSPSVTNNTIVGNTIDPAVRPEQYNTGTIYGAGIFFDNASAPYLFNNIVAFNTSGVDAPSGYAGPATLRYNDVYGNAQFDYRNLVPGVGSISADPLLDNAYRLATYSPCIDTGFNGAVTPGATDIDREPRINGPFVDIGADEYYDPDVPPVVVSTDPVNGQTGVALNTVVTVTFSEPIRVANPALIDIYDVTSGLPVSLAPSSPSTSGNVLSIAPTALAKLHTYRVMVQASSVADLTGHLLFNTKVFTFTTGRK